MDGISGLVNLIAAAVSTRLTFTLAQQVARSQHSVDRGVSRLPAWLQRVASPFGLSSPASWMDRFSLGRPSPENQRRLDRSNRSYWGALDTYSAAQKRHQGAVDELEEEKRNPTGKDLAKLQIAIIDYEQALKEAAEKLKETTKAHEKVKSEVSRQTKWQTERTRGNLWSPGQAWKKAKQHWRILKKSRDRMTTANSGLKSAQRAASIAKSVHAKNLARLAAARRAGKGIRGASAAAKASGAAVKATGAALQGATAAATAARAATIARVGGLAARGGPYVLAIAAVTAAVAYQINRIKTWTNEQLQKSETLINGQIRQRSQFNHQIAAAMARYDLQEHRLQLKTAAQTAASSEGVVNSTMRLKEAMQPRMSAQIDIGNRLLAATLDIAAVVEKAYAYIDYQTILGKELVKLLELLPFVKKIQENTAKESNVGIEAIRTAFRANNETRLMKRFPPIPPIK